MSKKNVVSGLIWKLLERFGVSGVQFVLQIILARLLEPDHYGALSMMVIFTALANVFIQYGFNTSLIQGKDVTEEDFSSVLWVSLGIAGVFYGMILFAAPYIAAFYKMPEVTAPLRVMALMLFPGTLNSVQLAKVSREMDFRKVFTSNIGAITVAGVVSIVIACLGGGLWALVVQTMLNAFVACGVMWFTVRWRPRLVCNLKRIRVLFSYGWKLLISGLIDVVYQDLRSLVIGKKYDSGTLGYYNRGKQFPDFFIRSINGAVQSVLLPAMSAEQDDSAKVKRMMRISVMMSAYCIFPMMAGLAAVATPLVRLLLTDKWLPCVPFLQIYCFTLAFYPVHSCNLQAINAMGRSDLFLKLEIAKKLIGTTMLVVAVFCFDSPVAIAMTGAVSAIMNSFINALPNKRLINYSYFEQIRDLLPAFSLSVAMGLAVYSLSLLELHPICILLTQVFAGVVLYLAGSVVFKMESFTFLKNQLKRLKK